MGSPLTKYNAVRDALRTGAIDPAIAQQILARFPPKFPSPSNYNALVGYVGPAVTIGGQVQEPQVPIR